MSSAVGCVFSSSAAEISILFPFQVEYFKVDPLTSSDSSPDVLPSPLELDESFQQCRVIRGSGPDDIFLTTAMREKEYEEMEDEMYEHYSDKEPPDDDRDKWEVGQLCAVRTDGVWVS